MSVSVDITLYYQMSPENTLCWSGVQNRLTEVGDCVSPITEIKQTPPWGRRGSLEGATWLQPSRRWETEGEAGPGRPEAELQVHGLCTSLVPGECPVGRRDRPGGTEFTPVSHASLLPRGVIVTEFSVTLWVLCSSLGSRSSSQRRFVL